ncbi:hypothetical protein GSI_13240 [Ganoderma sinense ZZ0214-1]|uniref:Uncharacterized protein n=1 Tax=Ganoderma sinense ZZ0214-1 TaxID=1077348 RepID=A0A2G8RV14_9APHY|nr:hypothetical protein GSI_13240 [Ganoderma sinense ZZ0214-1]
MPPLRKIVKFEVLQIETGGQELYELVQINRLLEIARLQRQLAETSIERWVNSLKMVHGLADLLVLLGSAPLAHLEIISRDSDVRAHMWARVFRGFPSLVSLAASADGALFDGLHEASLTGPAEGPVACQGLMRIRISDH